MRIIDADAFAFALKRISEKQGYSELYMNVDDVLNAVIDDLQGKALYGYENCPTVKAIPIERLEQIRAEIDSRLQGVNITLEILVKDDALIPRMEAAKTTLEEVLDIFDKAIREVEQ